MENITFANSSFLYGLLLIPILFLWMYFKRDKFQASISFSSFGPFKELKRTWDFFRHTPLFLRICAVCLFIIALARPQLTSVTTRTSSKHGVDIVMAVDLSASMLAEDLLPNRLEALKKVAKSFVNNRPADRIGIVAYAGEGYTQCPVTSDHRIVINSINSLKFGIIENGTAIGIGLGTAINRLKDSDAKSRVIILLTDGVNNVGSIDPRTIAEIASDEKIKVYTIGMGSNGNARMPVSINRDGSFNYQMAKVEIDEELLKEIAFKTNGRYFRAKNNEELIGIYREIDKLEKTEYEEFKYYNAQEKFRPFVISGLLLLCLELLGRWFVFKGFI